MWHRASQASSLSREHTAHLCRRRCLTSNGSLLCLAAIITVKRVETSAVCGKVTHTRGIQCEPVIVRDPSLGLFPSPCPARTETDRDLKRDETVVTFFSRGGAGTGWRCHRDETAGILEMKYLSVPSLGITSKREQHHPQRMRGDKQYSD